MTFEDQQFDDDTWTEHLPSIKRLSRDLATASRVMGIGEARFLVDQYYAIQNQRKRANSQGLALDKGADVKGQHPEPHVLLDWLFEQSSALEGQIKRSLDQFTRGHVMGDWMRQVVGIGPVISAGIIAHLEGPRPTAGKIYQFAGIAGKDQKKWNKGELRPYNTRLKTICWHSGQSFMKFSGRDDCFYGKLYRQRKEFEVNMSESGKRSEIAAEWMTRVGKTTEAYKHYSTGKLPPGHIDARARRYAVKIFLSHMNEIWLERTGQPVRAPFPIEKLGHSGYIPPPFR
jgi:hypothetical protein